MKKHPIIIIYTTNAYFSFLSNEIGKMAARGKIEARDGKMRDRWLRT